MAAGIVAFHQLSAMPTSGTLWALLPGLLLLRIKRLRPLATACLGFLLAAVTAHMVIQARLPADLERVDLRLIGEVVSIPEASSGRLRFDFRVTGPEQSPLHGARLRLSWYREFPQVHAGDLWELTVRLKRPHGRLNPGGFDYERYLFERRIAAVGYVRPDPPRLIERTLTLDRIREHVAVALRARVGDADSRGLLLGLAVGERSDITAEQWDILRATGTSHLMAISGLHIGLVALLGMRIAGFLWRRSATLCGHVPAPLASAVAALPAAAAYAALAGFSLPTQRALLMLTVALGAVVLRRTLRPWQGLLLALIVVLLFDPLAPLSAGFWLSFMAVAVIFAVSLDRSPALPGGRLLAMQGAVSLAMVPLTLLWFADASLIAPLANLIAIPAASLIVPLVLLGTALLPLGASVAGPVLGLAAWSLDGLLAVLRVLSDWQPSFGQGVAASAGVLAPAFLAVISWLLPRGLFLRWLSVPLLLPLLIQPPSRPAPGEAWLTLLEVGQGLAVVIETHRKVLLYDAGPSFGAGFDAGEAVVVPFLKYRGYRALDAIIVSHADMDHAGGLPSVMQALPAENLWLGEAIEGVKGELCRSGTNWHWDGVEFAFLWPSGPQRGNEASCVLSIKAGEHRVLLTGDIERRGEAGLRAAWQREGNLAVLVAPHHGSASSSSRPLVERWTPQHVLFAVGYLNRWNFPREEVVRRYEAVGSTIWRSDRDGAVTVRLVPGQAPELRSYRREARRYYHLRPEL